MTDRPMSTPISRLPFCQTPAPGAATAMDPFSFEAFSGLLRRLKLELALRMLGDKGARGCPLPMLKSIIKCVLVCGF